MRLFFLVFSPKHFSSIMIESTTDKIKKLLIIQFRPFGDVILATSGTELIKKKFPDMEIHFLATPPFHTVLEDHPFIDKVITIPAVRSIWRFLRLKSWIKIRRERYDVIIDSQSGSESKLFLLFAKAKYKIGRADRKFAFLLNLKVLAPSNVYVPISNLALLRPLGIIAERCNMHVTASSEGISQQKKFFKEKSLSDKKIIGIAVGSKAPSKQWYLEGFIALIKKLISIPNVHIILLYAPNELGDASEVYNQTKHDQVSMYVPTPSMRDVAALLLHLHLLICNEGALNHLSCATQTKTLCLFPHTSTELWSPQGFFPDHYHIQNVDKKFEKNFGYDAEDVFLKVQEIL